MDAIECTTCEVTKSLENFKPGRRQCNQCVAEYQRAYAAENKARLAAYKAEWARENRPTAKVREAAWRERNRDQEAERAASFRKAKPHKSSYYLAIQRAARVAGTALLSAEDREQIETCYRQSNDYRLLFDVETEVDHIIPLRGEGICGLHVPWNLRIVNLTVNRKKHTAWSEADGIAPTTTFEDAVTL